MTSAVVVEVCDFGFSPTYDMLRVRMNQAREDTIQYETSKWDLLKRWKCYDTESRDKAISIKMRSDKDLMKQLVGISPKAIMYASMELRNDKELLLHAISCEKGCWIHAGSSLLDDEDFIIRSLAIYEDPRFLKNVSKRLLANKRFVLQILKMTPPTHPYGMILEYVSYKLRDDKDVVLAACSSDGEALQYASDWLKEDLEVVTTACSNNGTALQYADMALKNDPKLMLIAAIYFGKIILWVLFHMMYIMLFSCLLIIVILVILLTKLISLTYSKFKTVVAYLAL